MLTILNISTFAIIEILYLITIAFTIILVIQQKGDALKTISWSLVILVIPVIGIGLYFFFGQNYRRSKIFNRKELGDMDRMRDFSHVQMIELPGKDFLKNPGIKSKQHIMTLLLNNSKAMLTESNSLKIYSNGKDAFDVIFNDIEKARHHIHLEYYIIEDDKLGKKLQQLLIKKAKEGVKVRVIYDDVGSWSLGRKYTQPLENAEVEIYPFLPVRFPLLSNKINYRNHRKIIVIDGKIGHVGGMNIADRYVDGLKDIGAWQDLQLRVEGLAVHSLQIIFLSDWYFACKKAINDDKYFPYHQVTDKKLVQITASGPDSDWSSIMQAYFLAITTAEKHIYIASPYFIPNESILTALKTAALSGKDVRIMLPNKSDSHIVFRSTLSFVSELLEAGVKVYFFQKGFNHAKLMLVDSVFASIGTANMDIRSFDQNFEVNALIYDPEIAEKLERAYLRDLEYCYSYTLEQWENRPWLNHTKEALARVFSPLF